MPAGTQDFIDDDEDFDGDESHLVKDLRKQIATLTKTNGKLESQLTTFVTQHRQTSIANALTAKGLNPAVAKFYPADAEVDDASLAEWISENADVFGPVKTATTNDTDDTPGDPGEGQAQTEQTVAVPSWISPEDRAAYLRMSAAGLTGSAATTRDAEIAAGIAGAKTPEELTAFLNAQKRA